MNILIMNYPNAISHVPKATTYAIRIGNGYMEKDNVSFHPLISSPFYKSVNEYIFDDINPVSAYDGSILFGPKIAERMLNDFLNYRGLDNLLVHCSYGINRSPAVAIAYNEIFDLGNNTRELKSKYLDANFYVYQTLIEEAKILGIK